MAQHPIKGAEPETDRSLLSKKLSSVVICVVEIKSLCILLSKKLSSVVICVVEIKSLLCVLN